MFNFRCAARAGVGAILWLAVPAFAQAPNGWPFAGNDLNNSRWASAETTLNNQNVSGLTLKWQFTTQNDVSATPSVDATGGYVYFPDWSGNLYKLNAATGATVWTHKLTDYGLSSAMMSRTTPTLYGSLVIIGASSSLGAPGPYGSYLLALNASDGSLFWMTALDPDLNSLETASPIIYNGIAYVGVSSTEEKLTNPTFRGSLAAVSLTNGQILWQTYFVPTGYSGGPVWSSTPVIDIARSQIYVTTGNNYLVPQSVQTCELAAGANSRAILACQASNNYEDSIVALDLTTGNVKWGTRCSADDAYITACTEDSAACPDPAGQDLDFGAGANLFTTTINGTATQWVGAGQKSGTYWALSPTSGAVQWSTSVGPSGLVGGIEWGTASDNQRIYVAISNAGQKTYTLKPSGVSWNGGSWAALNPATGAILWQVADPGYSTVHPSNHSMALGPVTVANGVVYAASMSGAMYAFDAATGTTLWSFQAPGSVNAAPAVVNGTLYWGTGYHNFPAGAPLGTASNTFYAFSLPAPPPVTLACSANAGQVGVPYSSALSAGGGVPPYTFSIAAGTLPPGLTLNSSTGIIAGTPTAPGSFSYTVEVADSTGTPAGTATSTCGIAIAPAPVTMACAANAGLVGAPYFSALTASGGIPPFTFSITAGSLPPGLTLAAASGAINGTPAAAGSFTFTAQAADSTGTPAGTGNGNCGIAIAAEATATTLSITPNPAKLGQPVTLMAQISPPPGSGTVAFYDGVAVLGSAAVSGGSASLTTSLQSAAAHTLHALYRGNSSYIGSASATTTVAVNAIPSGALLPATSYLANGAGVSVAVGDFNGDGKPDFVVADSGLSVWLGNGDGTFQAPVNTAGVNPIALATADFNGDGRLDLAVICADGVAVLLGNGDGTFQAAVKYAAGSGPSGVAVADFNSDGVPDLAVANAGGVSVLLGNGDGTFQAAVNYTAGSGPAAVAAGDFIGNGKADLAVVNAVDGTVSVLLGNGDGTFQAAVTYPVGANPQAVAIGDLNGDGRPDLVVANNAANSVSVLLGNGDGTFQPAVSYPAGANPQSIAVADVNGDGFADVVAADAGGNIDVLLGNGDGTLQTAVAFGAGSGTVSLVLADFNGDSRADVVATGGSGNTAEVLLGGLAATSLTLSASPNPATAGESLTFTGSITLATPVFGVPAGTLTFFDNGAALSGGTVGVSGGAGSYTATSLAVGTHSITSTYSGNAAFLASTSAALNETVNQLAQTLVFGSISNQTYGSAPFPVTATASSGLAVCYTAAGQCTVTGNTVTLTGAGSCTITANQPGNATYAAAPPVSQSFTIAPEPTSTALAVTPNPALFGQPVTLTAQISPAPGAGKVSFYDGVAVLGSATVAGGSASLTTSLLSAAAHTLRAQYSGNPTYVGSASASTAVTVAALPSSTFLPATPYLANGAGTAVAVSDFNGDGKADFAVANSGIGVWLGNGDGTFQAPVNSAGAAGAISLAAADFNGDGISDLAAVCAGGVAILLGNGDGTFRTAVLYPAGSNPSGLAVADFNGDGVPDLAVANANGVSILLGNGDGAFQAAVNYAAGSGPAALAAGDFIGNGKADLVVVNAADGTVSVLLGNGDGTLQPAVNYAAGATPQAVAVGDLNGDGHPDLVVSNNAANSVSVLLGNGDGTFQSAVNCAAGANPQSVAVEDVNGDGQPDVVVAATGSGGVSVLLGNGDGTLQTAVAFGTGSGPVSLALADFNGDSLADVVATGGSGSTAVVLLGGQAATSVALSATPNPATVGQPVTLTGSVAPVAPYFGVPAGTLTFSDNGAALPSGTVALSGGVAGYTATSLAVGAHPITGAYSGNAAFLAGTSAVLSETVNQAAQTIAFGSIPNQIYGTAPFAVTATASSGLVVSFASTTPAVCTVSGNVVTLVSAGACTIQATQAGNTIYAAAPPVNQSFQIAQGGQTITFGALSNRSFGAAPFAVGATASSGLAVSFASTTTTVCSVSGATVTLAAVGTCTIQATQAGNANWAAAAAVNQSFQIVQGSQTITFAALSNRAFGSGPFSLSATASSGLAVSFGSATPAVCTVSGATVKLLAVGTCTIKAGQAGNTDWAAAKPVNQGFQITLGNQTIDFAALPNRAFGSGSFSVSATASSGLPVSFASTTATTCTVSGATVTLAAAGTCTIQATEPGNANWAAATPVNQSFQIAQGAQTITFGALPNQTFGTAPFTVNATASSGLAVSFGSTTPAVCTVSGATVTLSSVGACTIKAAQAGNANWAAAAPVNQSFQIAQGSQTITFGALPSRTLGASPFRVGATASSGLAVSFASTTTAVCTISGSTVTLVATGVCTIEATQAGNANWTAATPVNQSFQVK